MTLTSLGSSNKSNPKLRSVSLLTEIVVTLRIFLEKSAAEWVKMERKNCL